jgi:hypothetical protein
MTFVSMRPSVWRTASALLLIIGGGMAVRGFTATGNQFWSHTGALAGLVAVALGIVWFLFVPIQLEFDRVELTIRYLFRRSRTILWFELMRYGPATTFSSCSSRLGPLRSSLRRLLLTTGAGSSVSSRSAIRSVKRTDGLVRVYSDGSGNRPNKAMELTATRRTTPFWMASITSPVAVRGPGAAAHLVLVR